MTARTLTGIVVLVLAQAVTGCGGSGSSPAPSAPSPVSQPVPPTYALSGAIFAATPTGLAPVQGVRVEASSFRVATTDTNGFYSMSGLYAGSSSVRVSKEGYETDTRTVTISADTRLDIQIVRRRTYILSGVVSEVTPNGLAAVEGVQVEEYNLHQFATTDTNGFYSMSGVYAGSSGVGFDKEGFQSKRTTVTINGDSRLDVQLVRR